MRQRFVDTATDLLDQDPRLAVVLADISADAFAPARRRHPDRVVNVGIREQLLLGTAGGMALTGLRPIVHTFASFLVERAFEQIKLDLNHQDVGAVLVSAGASYDRAADGRTHQAPGDVALLDTLPGWTVHVPGHADEAELLLRHAATEDDGPVYLRLSELANARPQPVTPGRFLTVRQSPRGPVVVAVGPMLDAVLDALADTEATVLYAATVRPFDTAALRVATADRAAPEVVLVEPYQAGTSAAAAAEALTDRPHRLLALGTTAHRAELRRYGTPEDHAAAHGLTPAALHTRITAWAAA